MDDLARDVYRDVVPDDPGMAVPKMDWHDGDVLNWQAGFNRSLLESHEMCGCFHCGRRFPTSLVTEWMSEAGEDDTGVCPYCGCDALIVGTSEFPLSTALLGKLYERWFGEELRDDSRDMDRLASLYDGYEEYLRRGIPFWLAAAEQEQ